MTTMAELELRARELFDRLDPLGRAAELDRRFIELARRAVGLWPGRRNRPAPPRRRRPVASPGAARSQLRELYSRSAARRLGAVQWLGDHGGDAELEALKAVLSIEESENVRREILRAMRGIEGRKREQSGEERCSSSLVV